MKADFSRDSFDSRNNFQRVLLQQGRVLLDSDWNEQIAILLQQRQLLARGVFGPYAAPPHHPGYEVIGKENGNFDAARAEFEEASGSDISELTKDFFIRSGLYCVDGVMIENPQVERYTKQPFYEPVELAPSAYLVFLDVWERHVTPVEFEGLSDPALRGIETAHRSQLVWQVRVQPFRDAPFAADRDNNGVLTGFTVTNGVATTSLDLATEPEIESLKPFFDAFLKAKGLASEDRGKLVVSVNPSEAASSTLARYRGTEHRLYRVEIHQGGEVGEESNVTFKWSRDNGSIVFPVVGSEGNVVTVRAIPGDASRRPQEGNYVELLDERYVLTHHISEDRHSTPRQLFKIKTVEPSGEHFRVTLEHTDPDSTALPTLQENEHFNVLRVWNHKVVEGRTLTKGAIPVPAEGETMVPLEDGLYLRFAKNTYRTGDYWLIPARAGLAPQPWEKGNGESGPLAPYIGHTFAPLAAIDVTDEDKVDQIQDLRLRIEPVVSAIV